MSGDCAAAPRKKDEVLVGRRLENATCERLAPGAIRATIEDD
jgi:hypothetical protein